MNILNRREFTPRRPLVNIDRNGQHRFPIFCLYLCLAVFICGVFDLLIPRPASAKERVDLVVTNGTVVTMDAQRRVIENGAVAVRGDSIVAVGPSAEIAAQYEAAKIVDAHGAIVMPGLINGHAHAAMSLFRGMADDLALDDWLKKYIFPAEARNVTEDFVVWGTRLGILEMMRGGITTYADMYYFEDAVARVTKEAGMRGVLGETIIDFPAPDNKTVAQALEYTQKFIDHWKGDPLIVAAAAPHSMYTCSAKTLQDAAALARRNHAPILIHLAEAPFELQLSREKYGVTPVAYLAREGILGPDVTGAHCVWVDQADIATLGAVRRGMHQQSFEQHENRRGRFAGGGYAGGGSGRGTGDGRRGEQQQPGYVRGDGPGGEATENHADGFAGAAGGASGGDGDDRRGAGGSSGEIDWVAGNGEEGGFDCGGYDRAACDADV